MPPSPPPTPPLTVQSLASQLEKGCKPPSAWRIGMEHESFPFLTKNRRPLPFASHSQSGVPEDTNIVGMFRALSKQHGWDTIEENGQPVGLVKKNAQGKRVSITLEPGCQLELSGAPLENIHLIKEELTHYLTQIKSWGSPRDVAFMGVGFAPTWARNDIPRVPKKRYHIMENYMPSRGSLGLDMMLRTCTVQVNLDYQSEKDMVQKFRLALALQPLATALFANSPFTDSQPNGFLSRRNHVWSDTDPDRTGMLPFVFDNGFGFEAYVHYALQVPMYFIETDGKLVNMTHCRFEDYLKDSSLWRHKNQPPTLEDWETHLTTIFPEVRLKTFLEMRGADCNAPQTMLALPAFWTGLLYDDDCLHTALSITQQWSWQDIITTAGQVARHGLATQLHGQPLHHWAKKFLAIAEQGLKRRRRKDRHDHDESIFLHPLQEIMENRQEPAKRLLDLYHKEWNEDIEAIFPHTSF